MQSFPAQQRKASSADAAGVLHEQAMHLVWQRLDSGMRRERSQSRTLTQEHVLANMVAPPVRSFTQPSVQSVLRFKITPWGTDDCQRS